MKVKALSRPTSMTTRDRSADIHRLNRNLNPSQHPFEKVREYTRALNATKLERMFSKPFVAALEGHRDGVYTVCRDGEKLDRIVSGSADGEIKVWSLSQRRCIHTIPNAHTSIVKSLCHIPTSNSYISCSSDKTIKIWKVNNLSTTSSKFNYSIHDYDSDGNDRETDEVEQGLEPVYEFVGRRAFSSVDHHRNKTLFATCGGDVVDIWDHERSEPMHTFNWSNDSTTVVKFNQAEVSVFASCAADRSIVLGDLRMGGNLSKVTLEMNTNSISWNPMEPFIFAAANENHNVYIFDMRKLDRSLKILKDHVSAVLSVDYSPTGSQLVTGSYDRSIRLFDTNGNGHSRDIYHTKRMQRIWSVCFSRDERWVVSASDEGNLRLWKAKANEKLGVVNSREQASLDYANTLIAKYSHLPEIKRIKNQRHVPKAIHSASKLKREMLQARKRKEERFEKFSLHAPKEDVSERKGKGSKVKGKDDRKKKKTEREKVVVAVET